MESSQLSRLIQDRFLGLYEVIGLLQSGKDKPVQYRRTFSRIVLAILSELMRGEDDGACWKTVLYLPAIVKRKFE